MSRHHPFSTAQARRWMRPNAHLYVRPDAQRFMPHGAPKYLGNDAVRYFWPLPDQASERKYSPEQPRDELGRWVDWGRSKDEDAGAEGEGSDALAEMPVMLAGDVPTSPPEIPKERPAGIKERNQIARQVSRSARFRGGLDFVLSTGVDWLKEYWPEVVADQDPPRTLEDLQERALTPEKGYDVHRIVEQTSARSDGFSDSLIDAPENLVLVPRYQHERISAWFSTRNDDFGNLSPRNYLRGKCWEERRNVGLYAIRLYGVLRP